MRISLKKSILTFSAGGFLSAVFLLPLSAGAQDKILNILYTGSRIGELEPCGCSPKTEGGGLARLSGYILKHKGELSPYVLVDAGNSMPEDTPQGRLKADVLLKSYNTMGYDAIAFFKRENAFPKDFLNPLVKKYDTPVISKDSRPEVVERGGLKINISSDRSALKKGRLNILLTDKPSSEAKSIKGWDVIITSFGETLDEPVTANGAIIVSGYPQGKELGILTLLFNEKGKLVKSGNRWQPLGKDIKEDANVRSVLNEYDAKVAELSKEDDRKTASGSQYIGAVNCVVCHRPFIDDWMGTRHSGAFASLVKVGKSQDPECVKCHVVGFGEGGFKGMQSTPELVNVQCESCHGPGREHANDYSKPMRPITESVCLKCHTKANSPDFEFQKYYDKINHK
ncbi:MAG: hypothetical protein HYS21_13080 [Deltaproteobacteria bacterium]|nr:hypothetical protein [Deltaproteobacteria bacterium]